MDFFTIIVIMVILYLVPELLRKRKPKEYKYPEVPEKKWPPITETYPEHTVEPSPNISHIMQPEPANIVSTNATNSASINTWQGNLDSSMVVNGFIFAEILSPPLAKRRNGQRNIYNGLKSLK